MHTHPTPSRGGLSPIIIWPLLHLLNLQILYKLDTNLQNTYVTCGCPVCMSNVTLVNCSKRFVCDEQD